MAMRPRDYLVYDPTEDPDDGRGERTRIITQHLSTARLQAARVRRHHLALEAFKRARAQPLIKVYEEATAARLEERRQRKLQVYALAREANRSRSPEVSLMPAAGGGWGDLLTQTKAVDPANPNPISRAQLEAFAESAEVEDAMKEWYLSVLRQMDELMDRDDVADILASPLTFMSWLGASAEEKDLMFRRHRTFLYDRTWFKKFPSILEQHSPQRLEFMRFVAIHARERLRAHGLELNAWNPDAYASPSGAGTVHVPLPASPGAAASLSFASSLPAMQSSSTTSTRAVSTQARPELRRYDNKRQKNSRLPSVGGVTEQLPFSLETMNLLQQSDGTQYSKVKNNFETRRVAAYFYLPAFGLAPAVEARLLQLVGDRYDPEMKTIKIVADHHPSKPPNKRRTKDLMRALLTEAMLASPRFVPAKDAWAERHRLNIVLHPTWLQDNRGIPTSLTTFNVAPY